MAAAIRSVAVTRKWSLWEAAGPAGAVDLRGDGLEMCAGQDPVDAPSAGPSGEEMDRSFLARRDGMGGAENVV